MNTQAATKIQNEFQDRETLINALIQLEPACNELLSAMPAAKTSGSDIQLARRTLLKASTSLNALTTEYNERMGLEFLTDAEKVSVMEVADVRKLATDDYHRAVKMENQLGRLTRELAPHLNRALMGKITSLKDQVKDVRQGLFALYWALPDLGMTFAEWNALSVLQRRQMRPAGRPALPLESRIVEAQADVDQLLDQVKELANGSIKNLEEALAGAKQETRGRPAVSPLGKLERQIGKHLRELEKLDPADFPSEEAHAESPRIGDTYAMRANRIQGRIDDLRIQLREMEDELEGVAVPRRELEKLRARHRDLALMESQVKGQEQAKILLEILQNEEKQQSVIEKIHLMDPNATESNTHKVNPRETRERIMRLEANGRLAEAELLVLEDIKRGLSDSRTIRAR